MIVRNKKTFGTGAVFAVSFLVVLLTIFSPVFNGKNGLEYADESFNRLSKGSSYFIPKVAKSADDYMGRPFSVAFTADKPDDKSGDAEKRAQNMAKVLTAAGANVQVAGTSLTVNGDLGGILKAAIRDSDEMFQNQGEAIKTRYGVEDEKKMFRQWHNAFAKMEKIFKKEKKIEEAKIVSDVMKKVIEPAYNFYTVKAERVVDHAGMMSGLLFFYVAYTMWWGYAIFYLFDGLGLSMRKAKIKKEA